MTWNGQRMGWAVWAAGLTCWAAAAPAQAQYVGMAAGPWSATAHNTNRYLSLTVGSTLTQHDRVILVISSDATATAPTVTDPRGNAWVRDVTANNGGDVRLTVFSSLMTTALQANDAITVDFGGTGTPTAKSLVAASFTGLRRVANARDRARALAADAVTSTGVATLTNATQQDNELVLHVLGFEGDGADVAGVTVAGGNNPAAPTLVGSAASAGAGGATANVAGLFYFSQVTAVGSYATQFNLAAAKDVVVSTVTYRAGLSQVQITGPVGTPTYTASNTPGVCSGPFSVELWNTFNNPAPPTSTTTVRVSSNSPSDVLWSDAACSVGGGTTLDLSFPLATITTRQFYIRDARRSNPTWTLTAARRNGEALLTSGTKAYVVNAGAATRATLTLPGQTFVEGTGNSGTPNVQLVGAQFTMDLRLTDDLDNVVTHDTAVDDDYVNVLFVGLSGSPTYRFTGAGACAGTCSVVGVNPLSVRFVNGVSTGSLAAEASITQTNASLTASVATPSVSGPASSVFDVASSAPTLSLLGATSGIAAHPNGQFVVRIQNTGTLAINRVDILQARRLGVHHRNQQRPPAYGVQHRRLHPVQLCFQHHWGGSHGGFHGDQHGWRVSQRECGHGVQHPGGPPGREQQCAHQQPHIQRADAAGAAGAAHGGPRGRSCHPAHLFLDPHGQHLQWHHADGGPRAGRHGGGARDRGPGGWRALQRRRRR
jgi:hypothetical protein